MASSNTPASDGETTLPLDVFNVTFENAGSAPSLPPVLSPEKQFHVTLDNAPSTDPTYYPTIITITTPPAVEYKPSPELTSLGFTLGFSTGILAGVLFAFALAMRFRSTHIAPRCAARPPNTIYNTDPMCDPSQNKGNPFLLGWVWWVLNLSYKQLLAGVPGTGTREGGMKV